MSSNTTNSTDTYVPCTLQTCPLDEAPITYQPNLGANACFAALFALMLTVQLVFGIRYRTWSFLVAMIIGLALEMAGYIGRVQLHGNPFDFNFFIQYLVCLTIAPAFFCAAIYLTFRRIVHSCDDSISWIRPKILSASFMSSDFICLVLQAAGGAITSLSGGTSEGAAEMRRLGINIMIAGLALQVASLFLFILYAGIYMWRWITLKKTSGTYVRTMNNGLRWKALLFGAAIASVTIFIRSAFRVAELREGFQSGLASNEIAFMILEGAMVIIACFCLTFSHPGLCLSIPWKIPKNKIHQSEAAERTTGLEITETHAVVKE